MVIRVLYDAMVVVHVLRLAMVVAHTLIEIAGITLIRIGGLAFLLALAGDVHVLLPSLLALLLCAFALISDIGGPDDDIQRNVPICVLIAKPQMAILKAHHILTDND